MAYATSVGTNDYSFCKHILLRQPKEALRYLNFERSSFDTNKELYDTLSFDASRTK
ncbi:hypothetical protein [Parashewanella curva]|uniref:hypothetical protein n=1 Tax=Parashewanella curva TaxID=2338552 RepID=UPI0014051F85|nr:hypothetical protein [Parashewanella curva]